MTITNGYATLAQLKAALRLKVSDVVDDTELERCVTVASRAIDDAVSDGPHRRRQFYATDSETRVYRVDGERRNDRELAIDDALSISSVTIDYNGDGVYEQVLTAATDYELRPRTAPYTRLIAPAYTGRYRFPDDGRGVSVTGIFGFNATGEHPAAIEEACLLWAVRLYKRPQAAFGILESAVGGPAVTVGPDKDIEQLLAPYRLGGLVFV